MAVSNRDRERRKERRREWSRMGIGAEWKREERRREKGEKKSAK